jgi:hypothetical protein
VWFDLMDKQNEYSVKQCQYLIGLVIQVLRLIGKTPAFPAAPNLCQQFDDIFYRNFILTAKGAAANNRGVFLLLIQRFDRPGFDISAVTHRRQLVSRSRLGRPPVSV